MIKISGLVQLCILFCCAVNAHAAGPVKLVVDAHAPGGLQSVQQALNAIPAGNKEPVVIHIRKGTYHEKIFIEQDNVTLEGESRDSVILTMPIARDEWRCTSNDDWGAAVLNIKSDDVTLKNLTVINSYGFDNTEDKTVYCTQDTITHHKTIKRTGHQMALRSTTATRLKAVNCHFSAFGGDTVSPWNVNDGMFYFKDCVMEGGVDFYCPRGWAYAEGCRFIAHCGDACIWHDGSGAENEKTVLKNCTFEGYDGFLLGRYHKDAQFYLVDCSFASNIADKPIYRVPTANVIHWGERIYYKGCHRKGGDYAWFADNLDKATGSPEAGQINAQWVFGNRWNVTDK
ncbi:pectinesterase family protein [Chitinophagaceae bacterium MMS25-I14]